MSEATWWRRLISSEPDFFGLLLRHALVVNEGVKTFHRFLTEGHEQDAIRVRALEKDADDLRRELRGELFQAFSTPIDREDLFYLSRRLDEVINYVKHTLRDIQILGTPRTSFVLAMSTALVEGADHLVEAIRHLPSANDACHHHARAAKNCENDVTKLYPRALKELFEGDDVKEILKQWELLRNLNMTADRIDEVADVIMHIVVKEA